MQEKKALSYARDHRRTDEERVPLHKRLLSKGDRHAVQQRLHDATGPVDTALAERTDERIFTRRITFWRKASKEPNRKA